jgi:aspartate/methionine/tyrosine aminotransferase
MVIKCSNGLKYRLKLPLSGTNPFWTKQDEVLQERVKAGEKVFDLQGGDLPRYDIDGFENKAATKHLIQVAEEKWDMYPGATVPPGVGNDYRHRLRQAICDFLEKYTNVKFTPQHMFLGHAVSGCLWLLHTSLLSPGDEVLAVEPSHYILSYNSHVQMQQSKMVNIPSDPNNNWEINFDYLRKKIGERTRAIVIDNPANPQGVIYSEKTLKKLIDIAGEHDLPIISDEMYQLITFDGLKAKSIASLAGDVPVIVLGSMTKFLMKPGWCLGWACFHDPAERMTELENAAKLIANTQGIGTSRIPTPIMVAATRTFQDSMDDCFKMVKEVERRRDWTHKRLNEIEGITFDKPQCALYGLFRIDEIGENHSRWPDDLEFCYEALREGGLLMIAGSPFGKSAFGFSRTMLYRSIEVLEEAYDNLEEFMKTKK